MKAWAGILWKLAMGAKSEALCRPATRPKAETWEPTEDHWQLSVLRPMGNHLQLLAWKLMENHWQELDLTGPLTQGQESVLVRVLTGSHWQVSAGLLTYRQLTSQVIVMS